MGTDVLCSVKGSLLHKMFAGKHELKKDKSGKVYIDRDGNTFLLLVNYLRNERKSIPMFETFTQYCFFEKELEFWGMKYDLERLRRKNKNDLILYKPKDEDINCSKLANAFDSIHL